MKKRLLGLFMVLCLTVILVPVWGRETNVDAKKKAKLNYTSYELKEGHSFSLKLSGAKAKSYKSSDKTVVKVTNKGMVTATGIGKATVTVKDKNGKKYKCKIEVIYDEEFHVHRNNRISGKEATCTEEGLTDGEYCETCGQIFTPQTVIPAKGHMYGVDGKCIRCGEMDPNYEPPHEHKYVIEEKEPTCTEAGFTRKVYCSICGKVFVEPKVLEALGHRCSDGKCIRCGKEDVHEYEIVKGVPATCTTPGSTDYIYCKYCGYVLQKGENIEPLGHEYNGGENCIRCGADKNGHIHEWKITPAKAPTCTDAGLTEWKYCPVCGYTDSYQTFIEPLGHNFVDGKCTRCGKKENE